MIRGGMLHTPPPSTERVLQPRNLAHYLRSQMMLTPMRTVLFTLLSTLALASDAQVATVYTQAPGSRVFTLITGGQLLAGPVFDDAVLYTTVPTFFFNGNYYSDMHVSTNGFITVGTAPSATNYIPISSTGGYAGAISAFGANLKNASSGTPEIRWQQVGDEIVVQWRDVARSSGGTERFSFQARIDLTSGVIIYQYGAVTNINASTADQPQVGLRGPTNTFNTQVRNFLVGTGAETWRIPPPLTGTSMSSTMRFTSTAPAKGPIGGEAYSYTPTCLSPTGTGTVTTNCAANNFTVSVNITSLGTATGANITASPGGTLYTNVGLGNYVCGPFTLGTPVTLSLVNGSSAACTNVLGVFNPTPTCTTLTNGNCILDPPYPAIPDNGCTTGSVLQATIPISGVNTTLGTQPGQTFFQSLELIIAHTYRGDLQVRLTSPSGQTRDMLINAPTAQAAGSNFGNPGSCPAVVLQLRDAGGQPLSAMDPNLNNISGIFTPQQSLSGFTGNPNGNWILTICDGGFEDAGSLRFVRLRLLNVDCAGVPGGTTLPGSACNDGNPNTTGDVYNASCVCAGTPASGVNVAVKVLLDGPLNTTTGVMADGLRSPLRIPTTEPYTALGFTQVGGGGETVNTSVFNVTGNDAIVDWVLVELRNSANNTQVVRTRCGLLQRDGDVVDVNGTSPLSFPVSAGNYFVSVRHRNHLGVMTSTAQALTSTALSINFSLASTAVFGTNARKTVGAFQSLWSGNTVRDGQLGYTGAGNDRDPILLRVGSTSPNNTTVGYFVEDVNMDATVKYIGADNDRDPVLLNVGNTTPNNVRVEQLP